MQIELRTADPDLSKSENIERALLFHRRKAEETNGERSREHIERANSLLSRYSDLLTD